MYLLIIAFLTFCLFKSRPVVHRTCLPDGAYMKKERTAMINGIFIWLVFICHMNGYGLNLSLPDQLTFKPVNKLGQCVVTSFFFFSGYGIMLSLKMKGKVYAKKLLTRRFPLVLLHFAIAVLCFYGVNLLLGKEYPTSRVLLALTSWESIGNSNWFITVTLLSYLIIGTAALIIPERASKFVILLTAIVLLALIPVLKHKGSWWVDTCLCIPAGMAFCLIRPRLDQWLQTWKLPLWIPAAFTCMTGLLIYRGMIVKIITLFEIHIPELNILCANIGSILFIIGLTYCFACVSFKNKPSPFMVWSGGPALFYLYIFQRIPMLIGAHHGWTREHTFLYQAGCFIATMAIALVCTKLFPKLDSLIFREKRDSGR